MIEENLDIEKLSYLIEMAGTVAFAVTAVLGIIDLDVTLFEVVVFAIITAVGGGTVRDVILDVPVFWFNDLNYIWVAVYSGTIAYVARGQFTRKQIYDLMLYLDGLGAALFAILATGKVWDLNIGLPVAPVILGLITAIGGGLIRDVLTGQKNLLMKRQFYAVPLVLASILFVVILTFFPQYRFIGSIGCVLVSFIFRSAAIHWNLTLPDWSTTKAKN